METPDSTAARHGQAAAARYTSLRWEGRLFLSLAMLATSVATFELTSRGWLAAVAAAVGVGAAIAAATAANYVGMSSRVADELDAKL